MGEQGARIDLYVILGSPGVGSAEAAAAPYEHNRDDQGEECEDNGLCQDIWSGGGYGTLSV